MLRRRYNTVYVSTTQEGDRNMKKAKILSGLSCTIILVLSALNLFFRELMYRNKDLSALFFGNDIVNIVVTAVFLLIIVLSKPPRGLFIGFYGTLVYFTFPLVFSYGFSLLVIAPCAAALAAIWGIVDELKIEEVLVNEKAPIKKEHLAYIAFSALFCVLFVVRAVGVLSDKGSSMGLRITSIADLALVALWLVLTTIALVNADKRVTALTGIMTNGLALELGLMIFLILDTVLRRNTETAGDIVVVAGMSLIFVLPSYRLLRKT
jgi:hypothetical protein